MKTLRLPLPAVPAHPSAVIVGRNALAELPAFLSELGDIDRIVLLYDDQLESIMEQVRALFPNALCFPVQSGESAKSLAEVERLAQELLLAHVTHKSLLVNIGGGVMSDLGGFLACVYMRGIRYVNVPTTLLAMADAAIGGKVYVNVGPVKNILGHLWYPEAVIVDLDILAGLPDSLLKEGLVEVVKLAAMLNAEFFGWLEEHLESVLRRDEEALSVAIEHAAEMKTSVVGMGKGDSGMHLLNFGHTVGHALEALSHFSLTHGKAVAIGMSCEMAFADFPERSRVLRLLENLDMPVHLPPEIDTRELWDLMRNDKKNVGNEVRIAVPTALGKGEVRPLARDAFLRVLG